MKALKIFVVIILSGFVFACGSQQKSTRKTMDLTKYQDYTGTMPSASQEDEGFVGVSTLNKKTTYGDAVMVVATTKVVLGRTAGERQMTDLRRRLDAAYSAAQKQYKPLGFTYSISPVGAINPLSDIEVQCVLSEESAQSVGQQTCAMFFGKLREESANADVK